jgi:hypothetical protein
MSEYVQEQIEEFLATNGNCEYPCWWGMMPGETNFNDALKLFESLSLSVHTYSFDQQDPVFFTKIPVPESINTLGYLRFEMVRD